MANESEEPRWITQRCEPRIFAKLVAKRGKKTWHAFFLEEEGRGQGYEVRHTKVLIPVQDVKYPGHKRLIKVAFSEEEFKRLTARRGKRSWSQFFEDIAEGRE
jgi:hypothetical protein